MHTYDEDIAAWAEEQAALLRAGRFDAIDREHLAEEIADVGKSEQRELANRVALLLAHLLNGHLQPARRGSSWQATLRVQRDAVRRRLRRTPSLAPMLADPEWIADIWGDAMLQFERETGLPTDRLPRVCPWAMAQALDDTWLP
jgi:hypothetical protein